MNLGAGDFLCYHKNAIAFIRQFYFLPRFVTHVFGQQYTFLLILMRKKNNKNKSRLALQASAS